MAPEVSDRYCLGEVCEFSLEIPFKGQRFIMSFHVPSYLVRDGFFPMFSKSLNEIPSFYEVFQNDRTGLYFETSKLAEGRHPWDYWMRIASPDKKETACPHPILWEEVSLKAF